MARMVSAQKILPLAEDPGIWGQPCRLVLSQKADNLLILKSLDNGMFIGYPDIVFYMWICVYDVYIFTVLSGGCILPIIMVQMLWRMVL